MLTIQNEGLDKAYERYSRNSPPGPGPPTPPEEKLKVIRDDGYDVIVVGAGMAGLSAAYEMKRVGLKVKILEQTERYGGRVFTYATENGLAPGLYGEGT
jgi:NADPH-dependent 2,4-dienoyl-CoA reductase/sulfur reductase-like enzyme